MTTKNPHDFSWLPEEERDVKIEWSTYDAGLGHPDGAGILEPWEVW